MRNFKLPSPLFFRRFISYLYLMPLAALLIIVITTSCKTTKTGALQSQRVEMTADNDSTEYSLIVLDSGFESYLASQPSAKFYSQQYYENWNRQYVMEWNARNRSPLTYGGFYETYIDYDPFKDYGLDLNFRLYYYFQFIKDKYGIVLVDRGR